MKGYGWIRFVSFKTSVFVSVFWSVKVGILKVLSHECNNFLGQKTICLNVDVFCTFTFMHLADNFSFMHSLGIEPMIIARGIGLLFALEKYIVLITISVYFAYIYSLYSVYLPLQLYPITVSQHMSYDWTN